MVAASKMKKAQDAAVLGKPYAEKIYSATKELASHIDKKIHPLLNPGNPDGKLLAILISTNKGLCGGLNTNLFRMIQSWFAEGKNIDFISVGKKGQNFIVRSGKNLTADFSQKIPFVESIPSLVKLIIKGYINGSYREVYFVYNVFLTAMKQIPTRKQILPIYMIESEKQTLEKKSEFEFAEFVIEPSIDEILDDLLKHYLENQMRAAILEAEASEHSARMLAMKNATEAATDFVTELTLIYNKIRQEKITNEIADTVTARMALE